MDVSAGHLSIEFVCFILKINALQLYTTVHSAKR